MRTIKFRGKSICEDTITTRDSKIGKGDWVYGSLIVDSQPYIVGEIADVDREFIAPEFWIPVDEKTVCQFTGLHDKNGVEIYEGDKLLMKDEIGNSGVVTVGFEHGGFIVFRGLAWRQIGDYDVEKNTIEVIGNIHEEEMK